jgi:hypothetical protein
MITRTSRKQKPGMLVPSLALVNQDYKYTVSYVAVNAQLYIIQVLIFQSYKNAQLKK